MTDLYNISILIPGMRCQGDTLEKESLGGSETAGICMARELSRLGHNVKVFSSCETAGEFSGVRYLPAYMFAENMEKVPGDILIAQRTPDPFALRSVHKLHILWAHDLAQARQSSAYKSVSWNLDKIITVSKWMHDQYEKTHGFPKEMLYASRNGLDLFRFPKIDLNMKIRKRLVYAARPERGLDLLLDKIFPKLLEQDPEFELALFGYDNKVEHMKEFYDNIAAKSRRFGDKVRFVGNLPKDELYKAYASFGIYTYPTPSAEFKEFSEVSCISAMEAMAAGMPIVTSRRGALPETIHPEAGILIDGPSDTDEYVSSFVKSVMDLSRDKKKYDACANAGMNHAKTLGWSEVAKDWSERFSEWMSDLNKDRTRLAHHFYKRNDVMVAGGLLDEILAETPNDVAARRLKDKISDEYAFVNSPAAFHAHYKKGGEKTLERLNSQQSVLDYDFKNSNEPRFHAILQHLAKHEDCRSILDYGCGHGWSTLFLANNLQDRSWVGVDIDRGAVEWAKRCAAAHLPDDVEVAFTGGSVGEASFASNILASLIDPHFDAAVISEVLEHCVNPFTTIQDVESLVRVGGQVIVTVPYGPAEYWTDNWFSFRNHIWEFDSHDLQDMFGKKPGFAMSSAPIYPNAVTGEMVGFHFVTYEADHRPIGKIDRARKLRLQRPNETLSACIMAGRNAELTLGWCLESVRPFVDEIVIADTGMNELGLLIAKKYDARIVPGSDPLKTGFETARNEALAACTMDWVLWIDTDEKLLGGVNLSKYTRRSMWHGLSIKQHHFAVDGGFTPDMPVRAFRRGPYLREGNEHNGLCMKFIGKIHEHPELDMNAGPGDVLVIPDVNIAHIGYLDESIRQGRFARNVPLLAMDRKVYPDRLLQKHFVMRDNILICGRELAANGGKMNSLVKSLAEETVFLYREFFLGKERYSNVDSLQYYTSALQILGRGIDVSFTIAASRDGVGDNLYNGQPHPTLARFETIDEAKKEIQYILDKKLVPLAKEHW